MYFVLMERSFVYDHKNHGIFTFLKLKICCKYYGISFQREVFLFSKIFFQLTVSKNIVFNMIPTYCKTYVKTSVIRM